MISGTENELISTASISRNEKIDREHESKDKNVTATNRKYRTRDDSDGNDRRRVDRSAPKRDEQQLSSNSDKTRRDQHNESSRADRSPNMYRSHSGESSRHAPDGAKRYGDRSQTNDRTSGRYDRR